MTKDAKNSSKDHPNLEQMLNKSTERAIEQISRNEMIEKQNVEMKRLLRQLPFQIFLLVALADEEIDPKEVSQFKEFLTQRKKHVSNQYTLRMFHSTVINYSALTNRFFGGHMKKDISMVEKALYYIHLCVSQTTMIKICEDLRELTVSIAEAAGGFMGMTSPISKEEKAVLAELDAIFDDAIEKAGSHKQKLKWPVQI